MKIYDKHEKKHYALLDKLKALVRDGKTLPSCTEIKQVVGGRKPPFFGRFS